MSFSISFSDLPVETFDTALDQVVQSHRDNLRANGSALSEDTIDSLDQLARSAKVLVKAGVVGSATVSGSLTGHANPGHKPCVGWANDCAGLQLYSTEKSPAPPPSQK